MFTSVISNKTVSSGFKMPMFGLGTWKAEIKQAEEAVKTAIDLGYRHFDCAWLYGNEKEVGNAIQAKIAEGIIKREDLFITSKVWNTHHSKEKVCKSIHETLKDLQTNYIDLYLIHWPMGFKEGDDPIPQNKNGETLYSNVDYIETWQQMEQCCKEGLTRSIGISNFNSQQILRVLDVAEIKPVVNQVECHPHFKQQKLLEFCKNHNIVLTAYGCLGSPYKKASNELTVMEDPVIKQLAEKYQKTPAQICLRYQIQRGVVIIPKSVNKERLRSNMQLFDFEMSDSDISAINNIPDQVRTTDGKQHKQIEKHPHYPFSIPF